MAQSNAVQDQPSMEDILTSIRRIIDDGNAKPPNTSVPSAEEIANDDIVDAEPLAQAKEATPNDGEASKAKINEIPELDSFLEALDAKYTAQQETTDVAAKPVGEDATIIEADVVAGNDGSKSEPIDSSIAMIDEAMGKGEASERDNAKYEARFSDDDRSAFVAVGDVLSAKTNGDNKSGNTADIRPAAPSSIGQKPTALVSEPSRARVGGSLNSLTEVLAQEAQRQLPEMTESILKPMLADWLDNNLPSMVERLVREEIERIARGD